MTTSPPDSFPPEVAGATPPAWATRAVPDYAWRDVAGAAEALRAPIHRRWLATGETVAGVTAEVETYGPTPSVRVHLHPPASGDLELCTELRAALHGLGVRELAPDTRPPVGGGGWVGCRARLDCGVTVTITRFLGTVELAAFDWSAPGGGAE